MTAQRTRLSGNRLHLQQGPIELVIGAAGAPEAIERAYAAAWARFPGVLPELVGELSVLRSPVGGCRVSGRDVAEEPRCRGQVPDALSSVGRRMWRAVWPYREVFITPMAAVAGSVAEEVLGVMVAAAPLEKAYVNNGGDIAIHLSPGATMTVGVVADLTAPAIDARITLRHEDPVRGIATSGWRGRSLSLGIADAVTVLAPTASMADAAATIIANAVDVEDAAIVRRPAHEVRDESDLGALPVTVAVGPLSEAARRMALARGLARAEAIRDAGLMAAAWLSLQGESSACRPSGDSRLPGIDHAGG